VADAPSEVPSVLRADTLAATLALMEERGLLDEAFFCRLSERHPQRDEAILYVERLFHSASAPAT
jgi:hypothetical protein